MRADENEIVQRFAVLMEAARVERGVTLLELAEELRLGPYGTGYLSRIERGLSKPSFARAVAIARALGINMEDFNG